MTDEEQNSLKRFILYGNNPKGVWSAWVSWEEGGSFFVLVLHNKIIIVIIIIIQFNFFQLFFNLRFLPIPFD